MRFDPRSRSAALALAAVVALAACSDAPDDAAPEAGAAAAPSAVHTPAAPATAPATPGLASVADMGVPNAREPRPGLITAGQPTQAQFDALAEAGYRNFISLRPVTESGAGWEEAFVSGRELDFDRLPIAGGGDLTRAAVEELDRLLAEAGDEPTVVYCGSSNRVGALMALRAHWLEGASPEEAMAVGRAAGMTRLEGDVARILGM